jgi:RimJ/RimL family protein N-acetyltransferase
VLGGTIRGKIVSLRTPREGDLAFVNALVSDPRVRREGQLWGEPATEVTWKERLAEAAKDQDTVVWAIDDGGKAVGIARAGVERGDRKGHIQELTIDPERWGRGLGTDAAIALHRYFFDYLDWRVCGAELAADNARGLRLAARLGYSEFGRGHSVYYRDGAYADGVWLRFDRAAWDERWAGEREYAPFPEGITR